jgi:cell division protein FtsI (penicillin-binding protein 3)
VPAPRGVIYDRFERPLAVSVYAPDLEVDAASLRDRPGDVVALARAAGIARTRLASLLQEHPRWVKVLAGVRSEDVRRRIQALALPGVKFTDRFVRVYPRGAHLGHVLGFVDGDGTGRAGIEKAFDHLLSGRSSSHRSLRDAAQRRIRVPELAARPEEPGCDVHLTTDIVLQEMLDQEVGALQARSRAAWSAGIVMAPATGEVLALASIPHFDPNRPGEGSAKNHVVSDVLAPGSAFKPFVMAAALEAGVVQDGDSIFCENGLFSFGRRVVHDTKPHGAMTLQEIMSLSSNIGMGKIAQKLGAPRTMAALRRFRLQEPTGLPLPLETRARFTALPWDPNYTLVSVSYGQEMSVSPIRLLASFSAFARDGTVPSLRLLDRVEREGQPLLIGTPPAPVRAVSARTAQLLRGYLTEVMEEGTGRSGRPELWSAAGKTGTPYKELASQRGECAAILMCFVPAENPRLLVLMMADRPQGSRREDRQGGLLVTPFMHRFLEKALHYLRVSPDRKESRGCMAPSDPSTARARLPLETSNPETGSRDRLFPENLILGGTTTTRFKGKGVLARMHVLPDSPFPDALS